MFFFFWSYFFEIGSFYLAQPYLNFWFPFLGLLNPEITSLYHHGSVCGNFFHITQFSISRSFHKLFTFPFLWVNSKRYRRRQRRMMRVCMYVCMQCMNDVQYVCIQWDIVQQYTTKCSHLQWIKLKGILLRE